MGYLIRLLYANNLSVSEFGLFYAILSFFGLASVFTDVGFSETQRYFLPRYIAKRQVSKIKAAVTVSVLSKTLFTLLASAVIVLLSTYLGIHFFRMPEASVALRLMILYWILSNALSVLSDVFFAYKDAAIYGSTEVLRMVLTAGSIPFFFYIFPNSKFYAILWGWVAVYCVMLLVYVGLFVKRHGEIFLSKSFPIRNICTEYIPFLIPTAIQGGIQTILNNSTVMILTFMQGVGAVAMYNVAQPIANILLLFIQPLAALLLPITIEFDVTKQHGKIRRILQVVLNLGVFVLLPFVLLLVVYSYEAIALLFKSVYTQASGLLKVASFQIFIIIMNNFINTIATGFGMPRERARVFAVAAILNIILSVVMIRVFGTIGALLAGCVTYSYMVLSWLRLIRTKLPFIVPWRNYGMISILSATFVALQFVLRSVIHFSNLYITIGVVSIASLTIYFVLGIFVFKIIDVSLIRTLRSKPSI